MKKREILPAGAYRNMLLLLLECGRNSFVRWKTLIENNDRAAGALIRRGLAEWDRTDTGLRYLKLTDSGQAMAERIERGEE